MESNETTPLQMIVSGTAGTGKSYLIHCLRLLLKDKVRVVAPTGVAAFNVDGNTLHSLLNLPTRGEFKGEHLMKLQHSLGNMKYLIIDEMSMVGRKLFGQVDQRLRQAFPHQSHQVLGGCSCLLFGDFGQLPPVMDHTKTTSSTLSDIGSNSYQSFQHAVVLDQIMRQSGQDPSQALFRDILLHLRDGEVTEDDWTHLMSRTPAHITDTSEFTNALQLFPTIEAVVEHNVTKLHACGQRVATIKAVHSGPNAAKASSDDASGLEPVVCLAKGARVMLSSNLWVDMGLVNGAMGTVQALCYKQGQAPSSLPVAVTVLFDHYSGPTLSDGTVPITPLRRSWSLSGGSCSRLQLPLKLAWAVTIHKSQGLTLDKVVVDIGKKEFCAGLTFVAISRVRRMTDLLLNPPFAFQRLKNLSKSRRLHERQQAEQHLLLLQTTTIPPTDNCSSTQQGLCLQAYIVYIFCIDHTIPSSPWMEDATPSPMEDATPSPPLEWMEDATPSPPSEWMEDATPSPPSEWMEDATLSPASSESMDDVSP